jgi:serine/threonine protein kinase
MGAQRYFTENSSVTKFSNTEQNSTPDYKDTFVLKTYHKTEAQAYYYNEVEAFRRLRPPKGSSDPNIIHFYGSFIQNSTYNVILDFADRGTLEEYFQTVLPPNSGRDIEHFWASLCGILKALIHIHEVDRQNTLSGPQIFQGFVS